MLNEWIPIFILGGLVALDSTEAFQTMFSQPLVIGPLVGFLLGDVSCGLKIGILLQLMYIWVMPIGTATFPDPATGSVVGSCGFIILSGLFPDRFNLILLVILIFVVFFNLFAGWTLIKQRQLNSKLLLRADLYAERAWIKGFNSLFFWGLSGSFFRGLVVTGTGIFCVFVLLKPIMRFLSFIPEGYLQNIELPIWGVGIGTMIHLFGRRRNLTWCLTGIILGIVFMVL
jgi:mannose/fructose/N-acetylgalactosamine-specific phosphotransferase system component IIC